jgi:hypothetical protein
MKTYFNTAIDSVQYIKTQFLNTFVKEEAFREPMQEFVNAQAQFARQVAGAGCDMFDALTNYDFSKLYKPAA